jgi:hypothetical protein
LEAPVNSKVLAGDFVATHDGHVLSETPDKERERDTLALKVGVGRGAASSPRKAQLYPNPSNRKAVAQKRDEAPIENNNNTVIIIPRNR